MTPDMRERLVRYDELVPCRNAFVDTRTPGSDQKENFSIIGGGVAENPSQHVHLREPHGFNVGAARQPFGCLNSQHSHRTAEVFVVHRGAWRITFGPDGNDGHLDADEGDVVSVPTGMFRGFRKRDEGIGFLWVVLGGDDPGHVTWAPSVFAMAQQYGLVLLEGGRLVDTTLGETIPAGAERQRPPDAAELATLATPPASRLAGVVCRHADLRPNPASPLAAPGIAECAAITPTRTGDGFAPGPIAGWWPHGFNLRVLRIAPGASSVMHARAEAEVLFVHAGRLIVKSPDGELAMTTGDTLSVPVGLLHSFHNPCAELAEVYVVRGGDAPANILSAQDEALAGPSPIASH